MTAEPGHSPSRAALERFRRRSDASGLLLRYATGRLRTFCIRQVIIITGAAALVVLGDPALGLTILALGFLGDAAECLFLRRLLQRHGGGSVPGGWRRAAFVFGLLQASAIAASFALAWTQSEDPNIAFAVTAFLIGATINAGLARPFFRTLTDLRLALFWGALVVLNVADAVSAPSFTGWLDRQATYLIAVLVLCYAAWGFLRLTERNFRQNLTMERQLLEEKHALALSSAALAQREAQARKLALVAEQANDSIIICDATGRVEWVNETFTRLTGHPREAIIGKTPLEVLDSDDSDPAAVQAIVSARAAGRPWRVEVRNRKPDGRHIWMETSGTQVFDAEGRLTQTIQVERDVTAAREHAAALAEASAQARAAAEAKSRFLATMSHEIRTPMNGVIGMASLLSHTRIDDQQRGYVEAIIESGRSLLALINDILDLSRLEAGKMQIEAVPLDVTAVVQAVARLLRPLAEDKGLFLDAPEGPPLWVRGDPGRIRQVLINLMGNAVRFTRQGGVCMVMTAEPASGDDVTLHIAIADTGVGIATDRQSEIFDSFTQSDNSTSREFGGTGLGLSIARQLARIMGGEILLRSEPGNGAVFTLVLTLPRAERQPETPAQPVTRTPDLTARHILVAEDNGTNRLILRKLIERTGATLSEAVNGAHAVEMFGECRPDLVIMDMQMPQMDGLNAVRAIRALEARAGGLPRVPIVMLTANAYAEDIEASRAAGCDDFLTKPALPAEIYAALERFLLPAAGDAEPPGVQGAA